MTSRMTWLAALAVPVGSCALLVPVRGDIANTNAALILVLVVVAFATTGQRIAGIVAALSAGLAFDFFLTTPYESLTIGSRDDLETAALLLVVGLGVTELAIWGRRMEARASRDEGYVAGISAASEAVARGSTRPSDLIAAVSRQLATVLGVDTVRFDYGTAIDHPRLRANCTVTWRRATWDASEGLPESDRDVEIVAECGGSFRGRFLFTPPRGMRLSPTQALVVTSLASDVGASLAEASRDHGSASAR